MEKIIHNEKIISIIYRDEDWVEGLNFITPDRLFLQVGSWWYQKGKKLDSHIHNEFNRNTSRTQEMTYVKKGAMKVTLFDEEKTHLQDFILNEGDLAVFAYGGHGYKILEDDTQIIEAKNGPFVDVDTDKTKF
jgi:oxalate decarboxylase/phosphoglucose isomerase-like protein (cupin superfamily)